MIGPATRIAAEGGPIETASMAVLILAAIAFLLMSPIGRSLRLLHVPVFLLLLAEREADPDLPWVTTDVLRVGQWAGREANTETLLHAAFLAAILWSFLTLCVYGLPAGLAALSRRLGWARALLVAAAGVVASVIAEEVSSYAPGALELTEELVELLVAGALLASVVMAAQGGASRRPLVRSPHAEADRSTAEMIGQRLN